MKVLCCQSTFYDEGQSLPGGGGKALPRGFLQWVVCTLAEASGHQKAFLNIHREEIVPSETYLAFSFNVIQAPGRYLHFESSAF